MKLALLKRVDLRRYRVLPCLTGLLAGYQLPRFLRRMISPVSLRICFFPLSNEPVELQDPLAKEFVSWRGECESTIRSTYQILSRGTPNLENETWGASVAAIKGTESPEALGAKLQDGLASWYEPHQ